MGIYLRYDENEVLWIRSQIFLNEYLMEWMIRPLKWVKLGRFGQNFRTELSNEWFDLKNESNLDASDKIFGQNYRMNDSTLKISQTWTIRTKFSDKIIKWEVRPLKWVKLGGFGQNFQTKFSDKIIEWEIRP